MEKISIPSFSERYKEHVEAERPHLDTLQTPEAAKPDNDRRPSRLRPLAAAPNIEEAYCSVRTENRGRRAAPSEAKKQG